MTSGTTIRRVLAGDARRAVVLLALLACTATLAIAQGPVPQAATQKREPLSLTDTEFPEGTVGRVFHSSVGATGGSGLYSILVSGQMPDGLKLLTGPDTVAIGGVPTTAGIYNFEVNVADLTGGSITRSYSILVKPDANPQSTNAVVSAAEGFHFTDLPKVFFPAQVSLAEKFNFTDLPHVFMPAMANVLESFSFTDNPHVFFSDQKVEGESFGFGDKAVVVAKVGVTPAVAPAGSVGASYATTFTAATPTGAATLTGAGTLPTGMSFSAPGSSLLLSGKPQQVGTYPFTVTVKDTANTSVVSYSLVVNKASQTITFPQPPTPVTYYAGENVTLTATSSAGASYPVSYAVTGPATLSGSTLTYTSAGSVTVTATQAGDGNYNAATPVQVSILVQPPPDTIFIANGSGTVASLLQNGTQQSGATAGGGIGIAVDSLGYVWSINNGGGGLTKFNDTGSLAATYTPSGISGATSLVFDGNSDLWVTNGNGSVSEVSPAGGTLATIQPTGTAAVGAAIDAAGNLWILNGNTVVKVVGVAAPAQPLINAVNAGTPATKP